MKTNTPFILFLLIALFHLSCQKEKIEKSGTSLSNDRFFGTANAYKSLLIKDIDGNSYQSIKIGDQTWMVENLRVTRYRDGYPIRENNNPLTWAANNLGSYCWYNNNIQNKNEYGALYNWHAVNSSRQLAPDGWHIPGKAEWQELMEYLNDAQFTAGALKEAGYQHWVFPNTKASDHHGFKAMPGGGVGVNGEFDQIGREAIFWTKTYDTGSQAANYVHMGYSHSDLLFSQASKAYGFSVRCIKD